ncbi:hypothetical protein PAXRUDRAFT_836210 [Paxillus rubicundulus Ve08.2h10]|uniref:Hydrophobin n=1 Tax=Paxillus rubicundulus Ve08.2h10 TaxID=930991 RepID=A0A0D0BQ50_9AGAM|nr:hypothetical protein PAXRUDRAFT_836210 [Paxillus rubicundulus Ve08.2h10]
MRFAGFSFVASLVALVLGVASTSPNNNLQARSGDDCGAAGAVCVPPGPPYTCCSGLVCYTTGTCGLPT